MAPLEILEKLFKLRENKTDPQTEVLEGLTTFVTIAYIIFVNPTILTQGWTSGLCWLQPVAQRQSELLSGGSGSIIRLPWWELA